jgi:hypothetical protein
MIKMILSSKNLKRVKVSIDFYYGARRYHTAS